jgi:flagellar motor switch protein FliN/FliY
MTEDVADDWAAAMSEQKASSQADAPAEDAGAAEDWGAALSEQKAASDSKAATDPAEAVLAAEVPAAKAKSAPMPELAATPAGSPVDSDRNLEMILDVPVTLAMEIGRVRVPIRNLLQLTQGSVVELDRLAGEPLDVTVNGTLIAHGEVVVVNERYGIRFTDVISAAERVQKLK